MARHPPDQQTRKVLLSAATESFIDRGFRGTSLDAVASRAGVTRQGLLHYFRNKTALLIAVLDQRDEEDRHFIQAVARQTGEGFGALTAFMKRNRADPGFARLFAICAAESVQSDDPLHEHFQSRYLRSHAELTAGLRRDQANGELTQEIPAETLATVLLALINGLSLLQLLDPELDASPALANVLELIATRDTNHATTASA